MHVGIIGAGIIGVSTACYLAERGIAVTLIDPAAPGEGGASRGNASQVVPALVHPLASPAVLKDLPRLLFGRDSPLALPLGHSLQMLPWLLGFASAAMPQRHARGVAAITALNATALTTYEALLQRTGGSRLLRLSGGIQIYDSARSLARGAAQWQAVPASHRGRLEVLDRKALLALEPALGPSSHGGVFLANTGILHDPLALVRHLAAYAEAKGAELLRDRVTGIESSADRVTLQLAGGAPRRFDRTVLAAGVWSKPLLAALGEPQRLETERGYNLTLPAVAKGLNHALIFADRGVAATQVASGLRLGGWDELGGRTRPPNPAIFKAMEALAQELLPGFDWAAGERWMGHRPSLPDSLPVICRSPRHPALCYGFGHGHLGMTQGPVTGQLLADLVTGRTPALDLAPYGLR